MIIKTIYNIVEAFYYLDWVALIITLAVCIITMYVGLLVISPMGVNPI